jgi:HPt (histidine-containing phosphotransfer) domain-containing protein
MDLDDVVRRGLGDESSCAALLHKFAARSLDQVAALERAATARNARELARQAQTLIGLADHLAARDLESCATDLERAASGQQWSEVKPLVSQLRLEIGRCVAEIPSLIKRLTKRS